MVERLLGIDVLVIQNEREVVAALSAVRDGEASFGDALIGALGRASGCSHTVTFDRRAARLADFAQL